jgi:hypothetical protein
VLDEYTTEEQRFVVRLLWAEGLSANVSHKEMFLVYGGKFVIAVWQTFR